MELIPTQSTFAPGQEICIDVAGPVRGGLVARVRQLDREIASVAVAGPQLTLPSLDEGGYGFDVEDEFGALVASTAFDVLADPMSRPRYGFVADYRAGRNVAAVLHHFRALHLNVVQFYDWAYRHAELVGPEDEYVDPLGQPISSKTVRRLADGFTEIGTRPLGYAAVYAVGEEAWPQWREHGLFHSDGSAYELGEDFLKIVDPSNAVWLRHFGAELRRAVDEMGFAGFHLDQYGWPKHALRSDGSVCDLADAFPALIDSVAGDVPSSRLIFNNVNDFPTWATAAARQDATYIEVWAPHTGLDHLGQLVTRARGFAPNRAVILAAYLSAYKGGASAADSAAKLVMATIFSHGGFHLLNGEDGHILVDPYYVDNHAASPRTLQLMRRWYDFAVRNGDLLFRPDHVDVTRSMLGGINTEFTVELASGDPVATDPQPGAVWARVVSTDDAYVVHLINLIDQRAVGWDAPREPLGLIRDAALVTTRWGSAPSEVLFATPGDDPRWQRLDIEPDGNRDRAAIPPFEAWAVIRIPKR